MGHKPTIVKEKKAVSISRSDSYVPPVVGLTILIPKPNSRSADESNNNIVFRPLIRQNKCCISSMAVTKVVGSSAAVEYSCFLKTCHLCNKKFRPDEDIYMYRGDQGFCSIRCRNHQIIMDANKEKDICSKRRLASNRRRLYYGVRDRCDTQFLREEFPKQHTTQYMQARERNAQILFL